MVRNWMNTESLALLTEYQPNGTLLDYVSNNSTCFGVIFLVLYISLVLSVISRILRLSSASLPTELDGCSMPCLVSCLSCRNAVFTTPSSPHLYKRSIVCGLVHLYENPMMQEETTNEFTLGVRTVLDT